MPSESIEFEKNETHSLSLLVIVPIGGESLDLHKICLRSAISPLFPSPPTSNNEGVSKSEIIFERLSLRREDIIRL